MSSLTPPQHEWVLSRLIGLIRENCVCALLGADKTCTRCRRLKDGKQAFPEVFTRAAEIAAMMGPKS